MTYKYPELPRYSLVNGQLVADEFGKICLTKDFENFIRNIKDYGFEEKNKGQ